MNEKEQQQREQADDVTKVNQEADDEFAKQDPKPVEAPNIRPPSTVSPGLRKAQ